MDDIKEWRVIPETNNRYYASSDGEIYDTKLNKFVAQNKCKRGWLKCHYWANGARKTINVHRLIMYAFFGISKLEVNHKDGNKENNHIDNLEYVTTKENCIHRNRVLKTGNMKSVYCYETNKIYPSAKEAGEELGFTQTENHISDVCRKEQKHCHGYHFIYADELKKEIN